MNGSGILANSASLSFLTNLPNLPASIAGGDNYIATNGLNGTLSLNYYVDANSGDPLHAQCL